MIYRLNRGMVYGILIVRGLTGMKDSARLARQDKTRQDKTRENIALIRRMWGRVFAA